MILPIEKQICSLELAKEMEELGFKQESLWYWVRSDFDKPFRINRINKLFITNEETFSAYTVAELGEMLPYKLQNGYFLRMEHYTDWIYFYRKNDDTSGHSDIVRTGHTEADARAKMLIYLAKEGLLKH